MATLLMTVGSLLGVAPPLLGQRPSAGAVSPPGASPVVIRGGQALPAAAWRVPRPAEVLRPAGARGARVRDGWILVLEGAVAGALIGAAVEAKRDGVGPGAARGALIGGSIGAGAWVLWWAGSRPPARVGRGHTAA